MIYGIGVDSIGVERIAQSISNPHFLKRVYSEQEQELIASRGGKRKEESAAGCFAAKEAFMKAAGVGLGGFALTDLVALRKESGAPYFALKGTAAEFCEKNHLSVHLSITHDSGIATAFVVLEG